MVVADIIASDTTIISDKNKLDGLEHISDVVERNNEISQNSEQASLTMAQEAGNLLKMVEP